MSQFRSMHPGVCMLHKKAPFPPTQSHSSHQRGDQLEDQPPVGCPDWLGKGWTLPGLLPEGEGVVAHEGLALAHQEGAILATRLGAVLMQQLLGDLSTITATSQLPVEPLLREVQLIVVELLHSPQNGHCHPLASPHRVLPKSPWLTDTPCLSHTSFCSTSSSSSLNW